VKRRKVIRSQAQAEAAGWAAAQSVLEAINIAEVGNRI
jgi:hypothetical protein